jgi:hypothetical protein
MDVYGLTPSTAHPHQWPAGWSAWSDALVHQAGLTHPASAWMNPSHILRIAHLCPDLHDAVSPVQLMTPLCLSGVRTPVHGTSANVGRNVSTAIYKSATPARHGQDGYVRYGRVRSGR